VLSGLVIHPFEDAADLLRFHQAFTVDAPDQVCCYAVILTAPPEPFIPEDVRGTMVAALAMCHSGAIEDGEEALRPLREFGDPIVDVVQPHPYVGFQQALDAGYEPGLRNYWKSQFLPRPRRGHRHHRRTRRQQGGAALRNPDRTPRRRHCADGPGRDGAPTPGRRVHVRRLLALGGPR